MKNSLIACSISIACASVGFFAPVIALIYSDAASASTELVPVAPLPSSTPLARSESGETPPDAAPAPGKADPSSANTESMSIPAKTPATKAAKPSPEKKSDSLPSPAAASQAPASAEASSPTPSATTAPDSTPPSAPSPPPPAAPSTAIAAPGPATVPEGVSLTPSQQRGMELFNTTAICFTCHSIGRGKVIGPDLVNVHERHDDEWLVKFIKSSQTMVKNGDPAAVKLFNENNKIPMPDTPPNVTESDIRSIIDFIKVASANPGQAPAASTAAAPAAAPAADDDGGGDADHGKKLFTGLVRFKNNGPTCIACHQVKDDKAITGGSLALELTLEYSQKGGAAFIGNILSTTPFPAMQEAYGKRPLTEGEVADLTAYLKRVDEQHQQQQGRDYGATLFFSGLVGAVILIVVFPMLWSRRRRVSVNHRIYDRQIKSTN